MGVFPCGLYLIRHCTGSVRYVQRERKFIVNERLVKDWITAIKEIQKAQEDGRSVIFVGAGVSKNSGVPAWRDLIKKFADVLDYSRCDTCKNRIADCPKADCKDQYEYTQDEFLRILGIATSKIPLKTMPIILA